MNEMKEMIKRKVDSFMEALPFLALQLVGPISLAIFLGLAYLVSISDLPDWFKFFLLR